MSYPSGQCAEMNKREEFEIKRQLYSDWRWRGKYKFNPLWGFPDPDGIVPKQLQRKALRLIPLYNDADKRFWISFWIGLLSPLAVVAGLIGYCLVFGPPKNLLTINLAGVDELIFWHIFVILVGVSSYWLFEFYCQNLFQKIDQVYFAKTGKTGEEIDKAIIEELEDGSRGAFTQEWISDRKTELRRQKFKAHVAYAFYGLKIPLRKRRYIKVPIED